MLKNPKFLFISFFLFLIPLIFLTYRDYGLTWDENWYAQAGTHFLVQILDKLHLPHKIAVADLSTYNPRVQLDLQTRGYIFDTILMSVVYLLGKFNIETIHLLRALFSTIIFAAVGAAAWITLSPSLAIVSMLFLLLFPGFYGHIFSNPADIPAAFFVSIAVLYAVYFLQSNQNIKKQLILGLFLALCAVQRLLLVYLLPVVILCMIDSKIKTKKGLLSFLKKTAVVLTSTLIFMHLFHPYLQTHPLTGLIDMYKNAVSFGGYLHPILFDGVGYWSFNLPRYYLPKFLLITAPLFLLVLFSVGFLSLCTGLFASNGKNKKNSLFFIFSFSIPIISAVLMRPVIYDGWRHFLFLAPVIVLISAYGLSALLKIKKSMFKIVLILMLVFNIILTAKEMIILHPYQYIYFNFLVGGLKGAEGRYETDYLGAGYKEAVEWFIKNINEPGKKYKLLTEGNAQSSVYYFKDNMTYTTDMKEADYFISFARWNRHLRNQGPVVYTVERKNVPLIYIRKVIDGVDNL